MKKLAHIEEKNLFTSYELKREGDKSVIYNIVRLTGGRNSRIANRFGFDRVTFLFAAFAITKIGFRRKFSPISFHQSCKKLDKRTVRISV